MHNWIMRHLHLVIVIDTILHLLIFTCCVGAIYYAIKFYRIVSAHPNCTTSLRVIAACNFPIIGYMCWCALQSWWFCLNQFSTWWSK
jgi:hypothetical protein